MKVESETPYTIEDLPDEVLEFILSLLPPYRDIHDCMLVSKRWRKCVSNVIKIKQRNLRKAIVDFNIVWNTISPVPMAPTITQRYSHAAAVHGNSMYVFGGCSSTATTFNDLWRLDLSKRQWVRPLTMGTYPSPKTCCSMVNYKDLLIVFGGWTYPPSFPLHSQTHLFNELHTYDIVGNRWTCINTEISPPKTAGHSVSIHRNNMVVFGGLIKPGDAVHSLKSNDVWKLNLETWKWQKQEIVGHIQPIKRYWQSQAYIDEDNAFILGGCSGRTSFYADAWVLNMKGDIWRWIPIEIKNTGNAPTNLWGNPLCKVGDKLIVLSRTRQLQVSPTPSLIYYSKGVWNNSEERRNQIPKPVDVDENVNGKRGTLKGLKRNNSDADTRNKVEPWPKVAPQPSPHLAAFNDQPENRPSTSREERRREHMRRAEERWKEVRRSNEKSKPVFRTKQNVLGMYVLDVSHVLDEKPYVTWLPHRDNGQLSQSPETKILYSFVKGKGELIVFGGLLRDSDSAVCQSHPFPNATNSLHFITAPKYVI